MPIKSPELSEKSHGPRHTLKIIWGLFNKKEIEAARVAAANEVGEENGLA